MSKAWRAGWMIVALVGCGEDAVSQPPETAAAVTWYGDVAHIARDKCMGCHNDEAPTFSMMDFDASVRDRASLIVAFVEDGTMPPWKPSSECNRFADERRLTDDEKQVFRAWVEQGAEAGDPALGPAPLEEKSSLPRVDRRLEPTDTYLPQPPEGDVNDNHCFVLDPKLEQAEQLVGFDIVPGEPAVVHHVLMYLADAAEAQALDAADPDLGYGCSGGPGASSAQVVAGWVPGMPANTYPTGTGIPFEEGKVLVMQIHYNTQQAGPLPDQTAVELMFSDTPMPHAAQIQALRNADFAIPPMAATYSASDALTIPGKSTIWAVAPHMHLLGRRALIEVEHPDGSNTCLLDIPDWDFNWQQFYFFDSPRGVPLEAGDTVRLSCTWDNHTPNEVRWGDGTEDEMCIAYGFVTPGHAD